MRITEYLSGAEIAEATSSGLSPRLLGVSDASRNIFRECNIRGSGEKQLACYCGCETDWAIGHTG